MNRSAKCLRAMALLLLLGFAAGRPLRAEDPPKEGWSDVADFSYVYTSGNSEMRTLGFKNLLKKTWDRSSFEINAGAIRSESTTFTRLAVGSSSDFSVKESSDTNVTTENYYLNGRYDRKITDKFFWFAGAGWDRNQFAGIQNRYAGFGGVGDIWVDEERVKFRTDYSLTYTKQEDVVTNPDISDTFAGARFGWKYQHLFGASTTYGNDFIVDENLNETSDFRGDMTNWVAVSMSQKLALKVSLQWLYDNNPSFKAVDLYDVAPPAGTLQGQVPVELESLDTVFTTSLVVKF